MRGIIDSKTACLSTRLITRLKTLIRPSTREWSFIQDQARQRFILLCRVTASTHTKIKEVLEERSTSGIRLIASPKRLPLPRRSRAPSASTTAKPMEELGKPQAWILPSKISKAIREVRPLRDSTRSSQFTDQEVPLLQTFQMTLQKFGPNRLALNLTTSQIS